MFNDTAEMNFLSPALLVFRIVPRLPIRPKELLDLMLIMRAIIISREESAREVANDRVKAELLKSIPTAADPKVTNGSEVLISREKLL